MLKVIGVLLLTGGAAGFSASLCREQKKRIFLLKEIKYMCELMQSEILYMGLPLPEIFKSIAPNFSDPLRSSLGEIGKSMTLSQKESLQSLWRRKMKENYKESPLTERQKEILFQLPEHLILSAAEGQARALDRQIEELGRWILQMEEEEKSKNKVIMSLGIAAGVFLSIVLL